MFELSQILSLAAFASFIPISFYALKHQPLGTNYWLLLLCPLVACIGYSLVRVLPAWHTDFVTSLWVTIAAGLAVFTVIAVKSMDTRRLTILFLPYMGLFAASATVWSMVIHKTNPGASDPVVEMVTSWLFLHIASSVLTYALITLAATAALAVYIREWVLKNKKKSAFVDLLPSMTDGENLQIKLMIYSEVILGFGLVSGFATHVMMGQGWLNIDHKVLLSLAAFVVLGVLLFAHFKTGVRGQKAARILLLCYLLVTMGFPGVKFVSDLLIAG